MLVHCRLLQFQFLQWRGKRENGGERGKGERKGRRKRQRPYRQTQHINSNAKEVISVPLHVCIKYIMRLVSLKMPPRPIHQDENKLFPYRFIEESPRQAGEKSICATGKKENTQRKMFPNQDIEYHHVISSFKLNNISCFTLFFSYLFLQYKLSLSMCVVFSHIWY